MAPPAILVNLQLAADQFFTDLQQTLAKSLGITLNWSKSVQGATQQAFDTTQIIQWMNELNHLNLALTINQKQFAALTDDLDTFKANSEAWANKGGVAFNDAVIAINNNMALWGVNMREAAEIAVSSGQAEINAVNGVLIANDKQVLSIDELNDALTQASVKYNEVAQANQEVVVSENEATDGANNLGNATKEAATGFDFLANRIKSVVVSLLIVQTIYQAIQAFKDLTAASQELAQTQFELAANVDYANKVLGPQIGNLQDWQAQIQKLSDTLGVFSKQDITQAVSKVIELTGQLGFTKDQMSQLIEVAANLSERTGKSLIDTITELSNAIGGGRLQGLHDLGLYIRATDLATESWTEGLGKNVNGLSDQQRAVVALNVVLKSSADLVQTTGDYLDSTAGQMAAADARVANSSQGMSNSLAGLNLALKNIWADFLGYVSDALSKFTQLEDFINKFNSDHALQQKAGGVPQVGDFNVPRKEDLTGLGLDFASSGNPTSYLQQELELGDFNGFLKDAPHLLDVNTQAYANLTKAVKDYADALQNAKEINSQENNAFGKRGLQIPNSVSGSGQAQADDLSDNEIKAIDTTTTKITDLFAKAQKDLDKAQLDFINGVSKAYDDKIAANVASLEKYNDNLAKIDQNYNYKAIDETTKYHRDLADLETEEGQKEADAAEVRDKKIIDNKQKYYDALRALDEQFYFDIFDAVANNDAIAVLAAERKYNLDKDKLNQNYKDQNAAADQNYKDTVEQIQKDTERRRQLLQERYEQQNQDYAIQRQREIDANNKAFKDDIQANQDTYDKETAALKTKWDDQKLLIQQDTTDQYDKLVSDLKTSLTAHQDYWTGLINGWTTYYQDLLNLQTFYKDVPGAPVAPTLGTPPPINTTRCKPGETWSDSYKACVPNEIGNSSTAGSTGSSNNDFVRGSNIHKLIIGSDGSVSETLIDSVIKQVADTIQTIVVERGG